MKLALEVCTAGVVRVVLAVVVGGDIAYVAEKECPATTSLQSANLRIEVAPAGDSVAGILDLGYCELKGLNNTAFFINDTLSKFIVWKVIIRHLLSEVE